MRRASLLLLSLLAANAFAGTGKVVIINTDAPGVGFNDPTPAAPVGGNNGTTIGQQRLNVFLAAAERWSTMLETAVDVRVQASFAPLRCTADDGVLGSAGATFWVENFEGAPRANTLYPIALANKLAGKDLDASSSDIQIKFNGNLGKPTCLAGQSWYYGFDGNEGSTGTDLFAVTLHEIAHGLGMAGPSGAIFDAFTFDLSAGRFWTQMSAAERNLSSTNNGNLVWDGPNVRSMLGRFLKPTTTMSVSEPQPVAREYELGFAAGFGAKAGTVSLSNRIVGAVDAAEPPGLDEAGQPLTAGTTFDGCSAPTNASELQGRIALVDRGRCKFFEKARNAQAAGAVALIVVDNRSACSPPPLGGEANDVTIPVVSITQKDGTAIRAQLTSGTVVQAALRSDATQLAGTRGGHLRLYAPCEFESGSSVHHWDVTASPNLLMEPSVNPDLLHGVDLTIYQLLDIGWTLPPRSGRPIGKR